MDILNPMDKVFDVRYPENGIQAWYRELMAQNGLDVDNLKHKNKKEECSAIWPPDKSM